MFLRQKQQSNFVKNVRLTCTRNVMSSNIDQDIDYLERFFVVHRRLFREQYLDMADILFPLLFMLITH